MSRASYLGAAMKLSFVSNITSSPYHYCSNLEFVNFVLKFSTTLNGITYTGCTSPTRSLSSKPKACIFSALGPSPVQLKALVSLPLSDLTGASVS